MKEKEHIKEVEHYYNTTVLEEWNRIDNRPEFLLTCRMLERYIKSHDKILDVGGGPGRYSLHLAAKGCDVTLFDLSSENIKFALEHATKENLSIKGVVGDAREVDRLVSEQFADEKFDHILLMGPMYHLLEEDDRIQAIQKSLKLLKPGGLIFISFINLFAGFIFCMKFAPEMIISTEAPEIEYRECNVTKRSYSGDAFTKAFLIHQEDILPFMKQFPLEKLHLFGQEGITSPCEENIMSQPQEVIDGWLDFCEKTWEREDFLSWSEHLMYVGRLLPD